MRMSEEKTVQLCCESEVDRSFDVTDANFYSVLIFILPAVNPVFRLSPMTCDIVCVADRQYSLGRGAVLSQSPR